MEVIPGLAAIKFDWLVEWKCECHSEIERSKDRSNWKIHVWKEQ